MCVLRQDFKYVNAFSIKMSEELLKFERSIDSKLGINEKRVRTNVSSFKYQPF